MPKETEVFEHKEVDVDDFSIRGTQLISKIYERDDMEILDPLIMKRLQQ